MFVIYISDKEDINDFRNCYGYYTGKCYTKEGLYFPVTDNGITERIKKYKSNVRATKGAISVLNKCVYVLSYRIEEIKD